MEADHYSKEWDDAPMPHSIFFTKVGHAIHGTYETKKLGTRASHGCVRLSPAHAATLFAMVKQDGVINTRVVLDLCVPKTSSVLIRRRNRLTSVHNDRADMFRPGRFGGAIQVKE